MPKTHQRAQLLQSLRELLIQSRHMDNTTGQPMAETLKALQEGFMDSDYPTTLPRNELAAINANFWAMYETTRHTDSLPDAPTLKSELIALVDELICETTKQERGAA